MMMVTGHSTEVVEQTVLRTTARKERQRRSRKDRKRNAALPDVADLTTDSFSLTAFTCPRAYTAAQAETPEALVPKQAPRVGRRARRKQQRAEELRAELRSHEQKSQESQDLMTVPSSPEVLETPPSEAVFEARPETPEPELVVSSPKKQAEREEEETGPRKQTRKSRGQTTKSPKVMACLSLEDRVHIDHAIQFFLLDRGMKAMRLMVADRAERKALQCLARAYRLTMRCSGSSEPKVVDLVKTKSSGKPADLEELRELVGQDNALRAPAELARTPTGDLSEACSELHGLRSPPAIYRKPSRMTRAQMLEAGPDPNVLELYYQRMKDGCGEGVVRRAERGNGLLDFAEKLHGEMTQQNATSQPTESLYERLSRAEEWLAVHRQNRHQIAARRRAVAAMDTISVCSSQGLSSSHTTPASAASESESPRPGALPPPLSLGISYNEASTGDFRLVRVPIAA
eukprot:Hpha_TRINITY_DN15297_c3_g4::TRINITY_DN15297_c3_g4_i7::g.65669::m.65669